LYCRRMTTLPLLDESHLLPLTGGDAAFRREILLCFLGSARENIDQLAASRTSGAWKDSTHRLKGLALSVGASQLAELAVLAENESRDSKLIEQLEAALASLAHHIGPDCEH
jgi:HPt (histidine-containing phosphotransfer) domain-containing protein